VFGHAWDEEIDLAGPAAAVATRPFVRLDAVDEGSRQELLDSQ